MAATKIFRDEKDVKRAVKSILDRHNWFWFCPPSNAYGKTGISDFIALRGGTMMAIETKFGTNKPTPMQVAFLNSVRAEQGFAFVVSDRNMSFFEGFMESFDAAGQAASNKQQVPTEHGSRMLNAIYELSNKILDIGSGEPSVGEPIENQLVQ